MAELILDEKKIALKAPTISLKLATSCAKLLTYYQSLQAERKANEEYYQAMISAYSDPDDLSYAEMFSDVSDEVDKMMSKMRDPESDDE